MRFRRKVNTGHPGASPRHALGQESAPATDVEHAMSCKPGTRFDVIEPRGIEVMQGPELAVWVPPARRRRVKFGDLGRVDIQAVLHPGSIRGVVKFTASLGRKKTTKSA